MTANAVWPRTEDDSGHFQDRWDVASASLTVAQQALVESHVDWAVGSPISRFRRAWKDEQDELEAVAFMGLVAAARKFDVTAGASFKTWAGLKIAGYVKDEMRERMRHSGFRRVRRGEVVGGGHRMVPRVTVVQWPINESGDPMDIEAPHVDLDQKIDNERAIDRAVDLAGSERNGSVVASYADGMTMREVGEAHGINESRVSQIVGRAAERASGSDPVAHRRERLLAVLKERGPMFPYKLAEHLSDVVTSKSTITNDLYALSNRGEVENTQDGWVVRSGGARPRPKVRPKTPAYRPVVAQPKPPLVVTAKVIDYTSIIADLERKKTHFNQQIDIAIAAVRSLMSA